MIWKAVDGLLDRIVKLEKEVFLLKPLEQKDKRIPEIYVKNTGTTFLLYNGKCIPTVAFEAEKGQKEGIEEVLDGIKKLIDRMIITSTDILFDRDMFPEVHLILMNSDTYKILSGEEDQTDEILQRKVSFIRDEIQKFGLSLKLNQDPWLEEKILNIKL